MTADSTSSPLSGVWASLVGQEPAVQTLRRAVAGHGHAMSHAWLITGPPGSGRSTAARAFAAALQCPDGGCGSCSQCRTVLGGAHPDVTVVRTEKLSIGVDEVRELVRRASMSPTLRRRQVIVVEDADRVTERGADALLKSIEEPARRTVWLLCAPTPDDVVITIGSRCRRLHLRTPSTRAVADLLTTEGADPATAAFAARVGQGHIGRARVLVAEEAVRNRRYEVLQIPSRLRDLGACLIQAQNIVEAAAEEATAATGELDARELADLQEALGMGTTGARPRSAAVALKDLAEAQKARAKRFQRDALDRVLTEFTAYHRDVLSEQLGTGAGLVNEEMRSEIVATARRTRPESTLRRIDAVLACRTALAGNVAPLLAIEAMLISFVES